MECEGIPAVPKTPQRPRSNPPSKSVRGRKAAQALEAHRLGKALLKNQKLPEALASFDRAIALLQHNNPRHSFHFHFSRALCLQKMCRLGPAVDDLSRCLFIRRTALCLSLRGTWLVTLGHQTVALNDFNEAALLQNTPHHNQQKGNLLKELGRDAEAVEAFTQALARGSGELRIQCLHARGVCLWKLGRAHDASRDLREVADAGCGSVQLQIDLARALHAAGDPTAEQAFSRVITERGGGADVADSAVIEAYIGRASLRFDDINRDKETLSDYTAAIDMKERLEGSVPPLWYLRRAHVTSRIAAAHGGDLAVALEDCHRAESLDPNNISVHKTIASLLSRLERHEEALRHFTRVVELLLCTAPPAESPELAATR
jgi:tetratricopeptide (TPR) repeat protein